MGHNAAQIALQHGSGRLVIGAQADEPSGKTREARTCQVS